MRQWQSIAASILLATTFVGCSNDSDDDITEPALTGSEGKFVDAPVKGLPYSTSFGFEGSTKTDGIFEYKAGDTVTFTVGKIKLGTTAAAAVTTPAKLGDIVKSTNIAFLLQNIDIDSNPDTITLPETALLEEVFRSNVNLYSNEDVNSSVLAAKSIIEGRLNITLPTISHAEAFEGMKENINSYSQKVSYEDLFGKPYEVIFTSALFGAKVILNNAVINASGDFTFTENGNSGTVPYAIYPNNYMNVLDMHFDADNGDGGVHDFYKFLDISDAVVSTCIAFNPANANVATEVEDCIEANAYFVQKDHVQEFLDNLNKEQILKNEKQVTAFSEITNQYLYRLTIWEDSSNTLIVNREANWIDDNGSVSIYNTREAYDGNTDWPTANDTGSINYEATFSDQEKLKVTRLSDNRVIQDAPVIKYDLNNSVIPATALLDTFALYIDDNNTLDPDTELLNLLPVKSFTFTSGNMYCDILYGCKLDKAAFDQVVQQIKTH